MANATAKPIKMAIIKNMKSEEIKKYEEREERLKKEGKK